MERNVLVLVTSATNGVVRVWESIADMVLERDDQNYMNIMSLDFKASANQSYDCDCASGHGSNLNEDDCKWTAAGMKEKKDIGSKDLNNTYIVKQRHCVYSIMMFVNYCEC